jgi:Transposase IS116/IS110/IS902 family
LHKILEDSGIKLGCVATNIIGKSGRDMLDALVSGTTDPIVLADLARGQLRKKIPALREALVGRFDSEHALIVGQILAHIDFLEEAIERLSDEIEERIAPFARQRDLLMTIPGVKQRTAEVLIAEIGVDMSAFPTPKHLASWAGVCPGNDQSAGKRRSGRTRKGSKWLRATLTESALAAARTKNSYLAAQYQRLRGRRGHSKAVTAVGHSILTAAWHMLQTGELYNDLGGDYFTRQNPDRLTKRLIRQLEALKNSDARTPRGRRVTGISLQETAMKTLPDHRSDETRWQLDPRRSSVEFCVRLLWGRGALKATRGLRGTARPERRPVDRADDRRRKRADRVPQARQAPALGRFLRRREPSAGAVPIRLGRLSGRHAESARVSVRPRPVDPARTRRAGPPGRRGARDRGGHQRSAS